MPIKSILLPNSLQQIYQISCDAKTMQEKLVEALEALEGVLRLLERDLSTAKDAYYFTYTIDLNLKSANPLSNLKRKFSTPELPDEVDPWSDDNAQFWRMVAEHPPLVGRAKNWLSAAADLIHLSNTFGRGTASIFEYDETQFAEPAAATLAMTNVEFVPYYARLVAAWDLEHEVSQPKTIRDLINHWGICPETENLIFANVVVNPGYSGIGLLGEIFPQLQEHFGDFGKSKLFRQIVDYHYARYLKVTAEDRARHQREAERTRNLHPTADVKPVSASEIGFEHVFDDPDLVTLAMTRVAKLNAAPFETTHRILAHAARTP